MTKDDLNGIVDELEEKIRKQEGKRFSARVLQEAREPDNVGKIEDPDCRAAITGPCGDTMESSLKFENGLIKDIRFITDGCGSSIACGSITTKMVIGKTLEEAVAMTDQDILRELGGLPEENMHCARLSMDTLHKAINDYRKKELRPIEMCLL